MTMHAAQHDHAWYRIESRCRGCHGPRLQLILDLGSSPIADGLLDSVDEYEPERRAPLSLHLCRDCGLLQIRETVDPRVLFGDAYPYFSSTSTSWVEHCGANADALIRRFRLGGESRVVEIASNDGYMLRHFRKRGIPVLGVEPSAPPARAAIAGGIPTEQVFFTTAAARSLRRDGMTADLVIANNVVAHVENLHDFFEGVAVLLKDSGVLVAEVPYAGDLVAAGAFDTIYHQHLCYFLLSPLASAARRHGLVVFDVERLRTHGGSMRVYFSTDRTPGAAVEAMLEEEREGGMLEPGFYSGLAERADMLKSRLTTLLRQIRGSGERVVAYGAAAKGTTLLHYCGIGRDQVDYVVDRNAFKHGRFMPGCRLPICAPDLLRKEPPDYLLLLAWNLREEILREQADYLATGGRIIVPLPAFEVISGP